MMKGRIFSKLFAAAFVLAVTTAASQSAFAAATIVIQNADPAGSGFNDTTPVAPVGNNTGTTLGQQRLNAFQFAANIWGATINSNVTITIRASWPVDSNGKTTLQCTTTSATLGSAGAVGIFRDFPGAPKPGTWYSAALANVLSGSDLDPANPEINARFNASLGNPGCLDGSHFYLGLDNNHGSDVDLVSVLIHEFAHGLGFQTFTNAQTGALNNGFPSIYDYFLTDNTGKTWNQMTDAERAASSVNTNNLAWAGAGVDNDLRGVLGTPRLHVNAPVAIVGNYAVGTADFGPHVSTAGTTGAVAQAVPNDGCSAVSNVSGKLALIDRGNCTFVTKVKNAQNAGAIGVIIANVTSSSPAVIQMSGGDPTISIPTLMISGVDAATLKGQLVSGLSATLLLDNTALGGVDSQSRALMYAPSTFSGGSSVSHWDTSLFPNQVMEPNISGDLIHSVAVPADLTGSQLRDIGWAFNPIGDVNFFVRQQYADFLNRQPDSSGQGFWTNDVFNCGIDTACAEVHRINVSAAFFLSIEFQETGYYAIRVQRVAFGRHSDSAPARMTFNEVTGAQQQIGAGVVVGQGNWQGQLEANKNAYASQIAGAPGFASRFPQTTADAFVDALFSSAGVTPAPDERQAAINAYNGAGGGNAGRVAALRSVADSNTVRGTEFNAAFVLLQYHGYLRRNPTDAPDNNDNGYQFWLSKLNQFGGNYIAAEMVKAFINSSEYRGRFGQP